MHTTQLLGKTPAIAARNTAAKCSKLNVKRQSSILGQPLVAGIGGQPSVHAAPADRSSTLTVRATIAEPSATDSGTKWARGSNWQVRVESRQKYMRSVTMSLFLFYFRADFSI